MAQPHRVSSCCQASPANDTQEDQGRCSACGESCQYEEEDKCPECGNTPATGACYYCKMD